MRIPVTSLSECRYSISVLDFHYRHLDSLITAIIVGLLIGARVGYFLFYKTELLLQAPWQIVWPFAQGQFVGLSGMSFHGGLIGGIIVGVWYIRKHNFTMRLLPPLAAHINMLLPSSSNR